MLDSPESSSTARESLPDSGAGLLTRTLGRPGTAVLQRIGWLRPSADERRLWLVEGAVILAAVSLIGTLMFLLIR